jgi:hypothetical protein
MRITAGRLNDYSLDDETTSGFSIASGWTLNNFWANRQGATVEMNIYVNRTGGTITATTGNITDTLVGTAPAGWRPNSASTLNGIWDDGTSSGGFVIGTDGVTTIRTASSDIINGRNLRLHVTFNKEP